MRGLTDRLSAFNRTGAPRLAALVLCLGGMGVAVRAQESAKPDTSAPTADATVESLFVDFLHYATLGRFNMAGDYAEALLKHPKLDPREVLRLATQREKSIHTLQMLVANSTVGPNAVKVLELIEQGQQLERQDDKRILANIDSLGGDPQQEFDATRHLIDSGEYAVPHMVEALLDDSRQRLHRRVLTALPKIGKQAVGPLVHALNTTREDVRLELVRALGEIGYPQAVPYLLKLSTQPGVAEASKQAAGAAIDRIASRAGRTMLSSGPDAFYELANQYYNEDPAVAADSRLPSANVWYWNAAGNTLERVEVETIIFGQVMAMRCCEESLLLQADKSDSIALWLASNIRREGRLGMNVESGDASEAGRPDATRPADFPRALYFSAAAGPRYGHMVLERAVKDRDATVALGAIEALRITAGPASLIGSEAYKQPLVQALQFPDLVVRIRAALALGAALPTQTFSDSELVIPVLNEALAQTGGQRVLVVDPAEDNLNRVAGAVRGIDANAVGERSFFAGMSRARKEFEHLSAVFISTAGTEPDIRAAVSELRHEFQFSKTPVVILTKADQRQIAEEIVRADAYCQMVAEDADAAALTAALAEIRARTGQAELSADAALAMALQSARTLDAISAHGRTVYEFAQSEAALIGGLSSTSEELRTVCASVLAQIPSPTAQRSIAHVALDDKNTESLRVATFASLARSARNSGNHLEPAQVARLLDIAKTDANLTIRTAASQALGAVNLADNQASVILRSFHRG